MELNNKTKELLQTLADRYENDTFTQDDPSQFLRTYSDPKDTELLALTASLLSFGSRKQFLPKIESIYQMTKGKSFYDWVLNKDFFKFFSIDNNSCFYRFYQNKDIFLYFNHLNKILTDGIKSGTDTFGELLMHLHKDSLAKKNTDTNFSGKKYTNLADTISDIFEGIKIVPQTRTSAKKRLCMYTRWMVRDNSPVDLGLWKWYKKTDLLMPLDVHVVRQAINLELLPQKAAADRKTAEILTQTALKVFPQDPCRMDFALFGLGINS